MKLFTGGEFTFPIRQFDVERKTLAWDGFSWRLLEVGKVLKEGDRAT
ncbi:hypothetical protein H6G64_24260 [Calothrix sp. FACHB-156]|nr:hypothetical protein [Calothrix sp. FACHB-156]